MLTRPQSYTPEDCDKVLQAMITEFNSNAIADKTLLDGRTCANIMKAFLSLNPLMFTAMKSQPGESQIGLNSINREAVRDFLRTGGFKRREEEARRAAEEVRHRHDLEMESLKLAIKRAKEAKSEARWAIWIASVASAAAILGLFL